MKLTLKQKRRYKKIEKELKEKYKKRKGLKIARGFKKSEEYKQLQKNIRNTIYRNKRKAIQKKGIGIAQIEKGTILNDRDLFFSALPYGNETEVSITNMFREEAVLGGKKPVVIIKDLDGKKNTYTTEYTAIQALSDLYIQASNAQSASGRTPVKESDGSIARNAKGNIIYRYNDYIVINSSEIITDDYIFVIVSPELIDSQDYLDL
jgi:hypothetical protein